MLQENNEKWVNNFYDNIKKDLPKDFMKKEKDSLIREANEHIIVANAIREILLNDKEQSYAVKISVGNGFISIPVTCNHKLADFLLNEIEEAKKALNGEENLFE